MKLIIHNRFTTRHTKQEPVTDYRLHFISEEDWSTIALTNIGNPPALNLEMSIGWDAWSDYTIWDVVTLNKWDKFYIRNKSLTQVKCGIWSASYYKFVMSWLIWAYWIIDYIVINDPAELVQYIWTYTYYKLFCDCTSLTHAPYLPTMWLVPSCYRNMFQWCTSLTIPPELPATTLQQYCYHSMFDWSWLLEAPELPATELAIYCYAYMFQNCKSMKRSSRLPATTLMHHSYYNMFNLCDNLETLNILPAVDIPDFSYYHMYYWCTKIKLSTTMTWDYKYQFRIPSEWDVWTLWSSPLAWMFNNTWWTFKTTPVAWTTYYTENLVI